MTFRNTNFRKALEMSTCILWNTLESSRKLSFPYWKCLVDPPVGFLSTNPLPQFLTLALHCRYCLPEFRHRLWSYHGLFCYRIVLRQHGMRNLRSGVFCTLIKVAVYFSQPLQRKNNEMENIPGCHAMYTGSSSPTFRRNMYSSWGVRTMPACIFLGSVSLTGYIL
jgi:hypothetical protein